MTHVCLRIELVPLGFGGTWTRNFSILFLLLMVSFVTPPLPPFFFRSMRTQFLSHWSRIRKPTIGLPTSLEKHISSNLNRNSQELEEDQEWKPDVNGLRKYSIPPLFCFPPFWVPMISPSLLYPIIIITSLCLSLPILTAKEMLKSFDTSTHSYIWEKEEHNHVALVLHLLLYSSLYKVINSPNRCMQCKNICHTGTGIPKPKISK